LYRIGARKDDEGRVEPERRARRMSRPSSRRTEMFW
jgi:hypothetical protein